MAPGAAGAGAPGAAMRRLAHELAALHKAHASDDLVEELRPWDADGEDLHEWYARLRAPHDGPYAGGRFELVIRVPDTYPSRPPVMRFISRVFHPNVNWRVRGPGGIVELTVQTGEICLDVLQSQWSPAWTLHSACTAVLALLDAPEPDSPLNVDAANLVRHDQVAYTSLCRLYTERYAVRTAEASGAASGAAP